MFEFRFGLPTAEYFIAIHCHAPFGWLSERTMRTGSTAFCDAADRGRRGLHDLSVLRDHRKCMLRIFMMLHLGWTGSHHTRARSPCRKRPFQAGCAQSGFG